MRTHNLPCDAVWLDIEYSERKKYFTWDKTVFPNPSEMLKQVKANGQHLVTIIDPHVSKEEDYFVLKEGTRRNLFMLNADGQPYTGHCWPGYSHWLDFMNPETVELLKEIYSG
jgi:mannosyl-oligosaccharide alpha-1,3-glucosidase